MGQGHQSTQAIHLRRCPFARRGRPTALDHPPVKGKETKIGGRIPRDVCVNIGLIPAGDDTVAKSAIGPPGGNQGIIGIFRGLATAEANGQPPGRQRRVGRFGSRREPFGVRIQQLLELLDRLGSARLPVDRKHRRAPSGRGIFKCDSSAGKSEVFEPGIRHAGPGLGVVADDEMLRRVVPPEVDLDVVDPQRSASVNLGLSVRFSG